MCTFYIVLVKIRKSACAEGPLPTPLTAPVLCNQGEETCSLRCWKAQDLWELQVVQYDAVNVERIWCWWEGKTIASFWGDNESGEFILGGEIIARRGGNTGWRGDAREMILGGEKWHCGVRWYWRESRDDIWVEMIQEGGDDRVGKKWYWVRYSSGESWKMILGGENIRWVRWYWVGATGGRE